MSKPPKPRAVNYDLIPPLDKGHEPEPYKLLAEVRASWHDDLQGARIALAWRKRQKADRDGHLCLGKCLKVSDLQKEFHAYDFVIVLNREIWQDVTFGRARKVALLDHELCHASVSLHPKTLERQTDEKGRTVYRTRKHDIEEFTAVVQRHGTYKRDLEKFAAALLQKKKTPLLPGAEDIAAAETTEPSNPTVVQ